MQSFGKNKATSSSHNLHKNKLQMDRRFKVNNEAMKVLDENTAEFTYNLGMGVIFLSRRKTQKP